MALNFYIQTVTATSGYFLKQQPAEQLLLGEGEDRQLYAKMIKCFIELDLNIYAAVTAQIAPEVDYSTAFKCLEVCMYLRK